MAEFSESCLWPLQGIEEEGVNVQISTLKDIVGLCRYHKVFVIV